MYAFALLLGAPLLGIVPQGPPMADAIEVVEINHCYNRESGERRFVQVIYWGQQGGPSLHVREWHMLEKCQTMYQVGCRDRQPFTVIRDRNCDVQVIRARRVIVTHTFHDPEEEDRKMLPVEVRRPLGR